MYLNLQTNKKSAGPSMYLNIFFKIYLCKIEIELCKREEAGKTRKKLCEMEATKHRSKNRGQGC